MELTVFHIREGQEYIELITLLKASNLCSTGGEARNVVMDSLVKVNGEIETRKKKKIRDGEIVEFNGSFIKVANAE